MPKYCGFCGKTRQDAPVRVRLRRIPAFSRRAASLDAWLRSKGRLNEAKGGARTYIACEGARVVAFYSLAASSVERRRVSSRVGRNTPEPIPVILLGQLAVDAAWRGRGLGAGLLIAAGGRALTAADLIGARAWAVRSDFTLAWAFGPTFCRPALAPFFS